MKLHVYITVLLLLCAATKSFSQDECFNIKTEKEKERMEKGIKITAIDSITFSNKETTAIFGTIMKGHRYELLLQYLEANNKDYYNLVKPRGEATECALYTNKGKDYADWINQPCDIAPIIINKVLDDLPQEIIDFLDDTDLHKRYWIKCQILIITLYQGEKSKSERFITALELIGEVK